MKHGTATGRLERCQRCFLTLDVDESGRVPRHRRRTGSGYVGNGGSYSMIALEPCPKSGHPSREEMQRRKESRRDARLATAIIVRDDARVALDAYLEHRGEYADRIAEWRRAALVLINHTHGSKSAHPYRYETKAAPSSRRANTRGDIYMPVLRRAAVCWRQGSAQARCRLGGGAATPDYLRAASTRWHARDSRSDVQAIADGTHQRAAVEHAMTDKIETLVRQLVTELVHAVAAQSKPANDGYLSTTDAAKLASVTPATIRRWVRLRKLKRHEAGGRVRVKRDELERLLAGPQRAETPGERAKRRFG